MNVFVIVISRLKKRNLFDLEYLEDSFVKLLVLLVCSTILPYNSVEISFGLPEI